MNNHDNPYLNLLQIIKAQNTTAPTYLIGVVVNVVPLLVEINNIQLDEEDMIINKDITAFEINDKVVFLISNDQQEFILLCKVR